MSGSKSGSTSAPAAPRRSLPTSSTIRASPWPLPDAANVIAIEGEAHTATRDQIDALAEHFYHKYEWDFRYDETADWRLIEITPFKIMAWGDGYDGAEGIRVL
jgi:hypothetical protein